LERLGSQSRQYPDEKKKKKKKNKNHADSRLRRARQDGSPTLSFASWSPGCCADKSVSLALTGTGEVLEPEAAYGHRLRRPTMSLAAARALMDSDKDAEEIARKASRSPPNLVYPTTPLLSHARAAEPPVLYDFPAGCWKRTCRDRGMGWPSRTWLNGGTIPDGNRLIRENIDSISVEPLIVALDGRPIDYLQSYDPHMRTATPNMPTILFGTLGHRSAIGVRQLVGRDPPRLGHCQQLVTAVRGGSAARPHRSASRQRPRHPPPMKAGSA